MAVHPEVDCSIRLSMHCSICTRYGHSSNSCQADSRIIYIKNNDKAIKTFLKEKGVLYDSKLHKAMNDYADLNGVRVVYTV
jgi:hypothetical protein